jgi:SAM-dependent methyltransferase
MGHCSILDIGSGEGQLASIIQRYRPATTIVGVETFIRARRERTTGLVQVDGSTLPFRDGAFDVALILNVLHHASDPRRLLEEAHRLARKRIIIKDHVANSWLQYQQLAVLDVLGNAGSGAAVSARYLSDAGWSELLSYLPQIEITRYEGLSFRQGILLSLFPDTLEIIYEVNRTGSDGTARVGTTRE